MPGFLYHLACAKTIADKRYAEDTESYNRFLMGNLIPDLAEDYLAAHFEREAWSIDVHEIIDRMDLKRAKEVLLKPDNPLLMGIYYHLYVEDVPVVRALSEKFSDEAVGLDLIRDGLVPVDKIFTLPKELPEVGIKEFDERKELSWRDEIEAILASGQEKPYNYDFKLVKRCLFQTAKQFLKEEFLAEGTAAKDFSKSA